MIKLLSLSLLFASFAYANTLTIYMFPSPYGISWKSPGELVTTTIRNQLPKMNRKIGHAAVEIDCPSLERHIFAGMRDISDANATFMLKEQLGMGVLFYNFAGMLENQDELAADLEDKYKSGRLSYLVYQINSPMCERLVKYYDQYRERGYDKFYGLPNRPRYGEGGGCTAFAKSFLEVAGFLTTEHKRNWLKTLRVPLRYIGKPVTNKKIRIIDLVPLLTRSDWAKQEEPHQTINLWDPDSMHRWVLDQVEMHDGSDTREVIVRENTVGLKFNRTSSPPPNEPIWLHEQ